MLKSCQKLVVFLAIISFSLPLSFHKNWSLHLNASFAQVDDDDDDWSEEFDDEDFDEGPDGFAHVTTSGGRVTDAKKNANSKPVNPDDFPERKVFFKIVQPQPTQAEPNLNVRRLPAQNLKVASRTKKKKLRMREAAGLDNTSTTRRSQ
jgi:hypothetical protein